MGRVKFHRTKAPYWIPVMILKIIASSIQPSRHILRLSQSHSHLIPLAGRVRLRTSRCTVPPLAGCCFTPLCWTRFPVPWAELRERHNASHQYVKRTSSAAFERELPLANGWGKPCPVRKKAGEMYLSVERAPFWPQKPWWGLIAVWFEHPQTHSSSISLAARLGNALHCSRTQASARWIFIKAVKRLRKQFIRHRNQAKPLLIAFSKQYRKTNTRPARELWCFLYTPW